MVIATQITSPLKTQPVSIPNPLDDDFSCPPFLFSVVLRLFLSPLNRKTNNNMSIEAHTLIDSGCSNNFISPSYVEHFGIETVPIANLPRSLSPTVRKHHNTSTRRLSSCAVVSATIQKSSTSMWYR